LCLSAGNRKNKVGIKDGFVQPKSAQSGCTGLSGGAPDSVRCARLALTNKLLSGFHQRCTAINHRTVRCAPDCPVSQRSAARSARDTWPSQRSKGGTGLSGVHRTVRCANGSEAANGRLRQIRKEIRTGQCPVVHRTVRCARRQKARFAFQQCSQRLLAALGL
jgi:hypothetical protein